MKRRFLVIFISSMVFFLAGFTSGILLNQLVFPQFFQNQGLLSPFSSEKQLSDSLQRYSFEEIDSYPFTTSKITLGENISDDNSYQEYIFNFHTTDKNMSGLATLPQQLSLNPDKLKVVILIRGWADASNYFSGLGTTPAARVFAQNGYIALAPDFLGFGKSDPEPDNFWEARFIKPINVIELIKSVQEFGPPLPSNIQINRTNWSDLPIFIWAHSNGGQIALSALEITSWSIPTALWAPVTAPFPYSVLFYGDELEDEGKQQRAWLALFEKNYNALEFSPSQYLHRLGGPIQLHHGTNDEAALKSWSDEFVRKINQENEIRANSTEDLRAPIEINYYVYPGADHNFRPISNWQRAINRDLSFFAKYSSF